jgi:hypothetical protein
LNGFHQLREQLVAGTLHHHQNTVSLLLFQLLVLLTVNSLKIQLLKREISLCTL